MWRSALFALVFSCVAGLSLMALADCMGPYPPSMVKAFNDNCAKDASMTSFCTCLIDEVEKNIPLYDFIEIGSAAGGINGDPRFIKASQKCSPLINGGAPASSHSSTVITSPNSSYRIIQTAPSGNGR